MTEKRPEEVVLDVGGVGYEVRVPLSTFLQLPEEGKTVGLRIHTHVREEALQLYGFLREADRAVFRLLLGISGVGPRLALAILSGLPAEPLLGAIRQGDLRALVAVPGVGKKTAERILVDLRDRASELEAGEEAEPGQDGVERATVSALLNLGYPAAHAERSVRAALEELPADPGLQAVIREALRVAAG
ncbi:MAG: Holliday junction branch migration protein RuvA [Proteobacteria bacterium]|nr:Holliday junction branch migration protein RuvA [Pseudomonadota bacterium]